MGYADRDDYLHDYDPGSSTGIFPVIRQAPGPGGDPYAGYAWQEASTPGHYGRRAGYPAGFPGRAGRASRAPARPGGSAHRGRSCRGCGPTGG